MFTHAARRGSRTARASSSARSGGALQRTRRSAGSASGAEGAFTPSPGMGFLAGAHQLERAAADVLFDVGGGDVAILGEVELARLALAEGDLDDGGVAQQLEGEA